VNIGNVAKSGCFFAHFLWALDNVTVDCSVIANPDEWTRAFPSFVAVLQVYDPGILVIPVTPPKTMYIPVTTIVSVIQKSCRCPLFTTIFNDEFKPVNQENVGLRDCLGGENRSLMNQHLIIIALIAWICHPPLECIQYFVTRCLCGTKYCG
jgi:hypothetical protein